MIANDSKRVRVKGTPFLWTINQGSLSQYIIILSFIKEIYISNIFEGFKPSPNYIYIITYY